MSAHDGRLAEVSAATRALLDRPLELDLAEPNDCARRLGVLADELHAALAADPLPEPARVAALVDDLVEVNELRDRLREHVTARRYDTLEHIHLALARLRALPATADLITMAAEELARCCGFDRVAISRVRGSAWRAEALWIAPDHDPEIAAGLEEYLTRGWIPLDTRVLEGEIVRRRLPVLVHADVNRLDDTLMTISQSRAYVAAPIFAGGRVVGFIQADCHETARDLTTLDRDSVASFADGFGLIFERTAMLERIERQRVRVREALTAAERHLSGAEESETVLIRRDRESVSVVRMAAGLRRTSISQIDQLLTLRERQVVELMVEGARNRQIGDRLVITEETVKSHVRSISRKLRASSRAEAVSRYLQLRLREGAS